MQSRMWFIGATIYTAVIVAFPAADSRAAIELGEDSGLSLFGGVARGQPGGR